MGRCSDAIEIRPGPRWSHTSSPQGIADGEIPEGVEAQARFAWEYILARLEKGEMNIADIEKLTTSLT
jgi:hypothetical protein